MTDWVDRYWEKVDVRSPDECWMWQARTNSAGYGQLALKPRTVRAHRLAWELANGPIPDGLCVLHRCDRPGCQNPAHLFLGTDADNHRDMEEKGRIARGAKNGSAKLTREEVREIRKLYATGRHSQRTLARQFSISPAHLCDIVNKKRWAWLD